MSRSESNAKYYRENRERLLAQQRVQRARQPFVLKPIDTGPATINLPKIYGDCAKMRELNGGPCNVVGCKWHAFTMLPAKILGYINRGERDDDKILERLFEKETCILRACDRGLDTLEEIGQICRVTRERIRQIEKKAVGKMKHFSRRKKLEHFNKRKKLEVIK